MSQALDIKKAVAIQLTGDQALVLFEWIKRFNLGDAKSFEDQAEERVLWDIEAMLEQELVEPFAHDYDRQLAEARAAVRDLIEKSPRDDDIERDGAPD